MKEKDEFFEIVLDNRIITVNVTKVVKILSWDKDKTFEQNFPLFHLTKNCK